MSEHLVSLFGDSDTSSVDDDDPLLEPPSPLPFTPMSGTKDLSRRGPAGPGRRTARSKASSSDATSLSMAGLDAKPLLFLRERSLSASDLIEERPPGGVHPASAPHPSPARHAPSAGGASARHGGGALSSVPPGTGGGAGVPTPAATGTATAVAARRGIRAPSFSGRLSDRRAAPTLTAATPPRLPPPMPAGLMFTPPPAAERVPDASTGSGGVLPPSPPPAAAATAAVAPPHGGDGVRGQSAVAPFVPSQRQRRREARQRRRRANKQHGGTKPSFDGHGGGGGDGDDTMPLVALPPPLPPAADAVPSGASATPPPPPPDVAGAVGGEYLPGPVLHPDGHLPVKCVPSAFPAVTSVCPQLAQEVEEGNTEYKLQLKDIGADRLTHLITQMKWRLRESPASDVTQAVYRVGVQDDGTPKGISQAVMHESLYTLLRMADASGAHMYIVGVQAGQTDGSLTAKVVIRPRVTTATCPEIRVVALGDVDSGKSTAIAVLTTGGLDNGAGLKRLQVFRHIHEVEDGRTSSISHQVLGFNSSGEVTNRAKGIGRAPTPAEVVRASSKTVALVDLAGHKKYLKTTVFGLTGQAPDYAMVAVPAHTGVSRVTREHVAVVLSLRVPTIVVVTKTDLSTPAATKHTVAALTSIVESVSADKDTMVVDTCDDAEEAASRLTAEGVVPIVLTSSVTGQGLDVLQRLLFVLPRNKEWAHREKQPAEMRVTDSFEVPRVGTVVAGTLYRGSVAVHSQLLMGPDGLGRFRPVVVKSIHRRHMTVPQAVAGQSVTFGLQLPDGTPLRRAHIRKGMVLVAGSAEPAAIRAFEADILVLHHGSALRVRAGEDGSGPKYQPVVHAGTIRQTARITSLSRRVLRTGDRARATFTFLYHPEYMTKGMSVIFREGRARGVGRVVKIHPPTPGAARPAAGAGAGVGAGAGAGTAPDGAAADVGAADSGADPPQRATEAGGDATTTDAARSAGRDGGGGGDDDTPTDAEAATVRSAGQDGGGGDGDATATDADTAGEAAVCH